jgi:hypothetical protein
MKIQCQSYMKITACYPFEQENDSRCKDMKLQTLEKMLQKAAEELKVRLAMNFVLK